MEEWRSIAEFEGSYEVSNLGRVRRIRLVRGAPKVPFILSTWTSNSGYVQVKLKNNGRSSNKYIHRLVAYHFLDKKSDLTEVNHLDGNKTNNKVDNLEWVSKSQNQLHKNRVLRLNQYKVHVFLSPEGVRHETTNLSEFSEKHGLNRQSMGRVSSGREITTKDGDEPPKH
ncbi:NUMOD4 motif-containing HNH endonuclease [Candidatus Macondimonas diazotrophica]